MHTYPAHVRIHKPPPNAIFADILHVTTSVQEHTQHALAEVDYGRVLFGFGRFSCVIGHSVFLWDWGNDKRGMKVDQCLP